MDSGFRGDRLAQLRKKRGLTQYDMADEIGISQNQMSRYERGTINPSPLVLIQLADYFDTTTDYLLGRSNIPHPGAEPDPHPDLTPTEIDMLDLFRSHTPDDQKRVLAALLALRGIGGDSEST